MKAHKVLATDGLAPKAVDLLAAEPSLEVEIRKGVSADDLLKLVPGVHGLIIRSATKITPEVLDAAKDLRVIGRAGIGVDNVDVGAASRHGIVVMNTPQGNTVTTAEHAIALMLAAARRIPQATASLKSGKWERKRFQGTEICGKTLGVVGLGNIGRVVASRGVGLCMRVVASDPFISADAAKRLGVELMELDELLASADFITVHTPLNKDTKGLLGERALAKCKKGVVIINAARGGIVDENALAKALGSGQVGAAALDVYTSEPPKDVAVLGLENVVCTPHLGASTGEAQERVGVEIAQQVAAFLVRGEIRNAVNLPPLPPESADRLAPWLDLAARLGSFVGQLSDAGVEEVTVELTGDIAEAPKAASASALSGLLRTFMDVPINWVNAPLVARERGVRVAEVLKSDGTDWQRAIGIRLRGRGGERYVVGSLLHLGEEPEPHVVQIDDFLVRATPQGSLLVLRNEDKPGVIGGVGNLLGQHGINVSRMQVGLRRDRKEAMQLWNVDSELPQALVEKVRALPSVLNATQVKL